MLAILAISKKSLILSTRQNYLTDTVQVKLLLLRIFIVSFWCSVIVSTFLFLFHVLKQSNLKPKVSFVKNKVIGHFVCKNRKTPYK